MRFVVDRLPRGLQLLDAVERIGTRQQRALDISPLIGGLALQTSQNCLGACVESKNQRSLSPEHLPVPDFRIDGGAAARGNYRAVASEELTQDGPLAGAEGGFPLIPKDGRDGLAPLPLDLGV